MSVDTELEAWRRQWQTQTTVPADLRKKVERQSRNMRAILIARIALTVVVGGGYTAWAVISRDGVFALGLWLILIGAWSFAWINGRGNWHPVTSSSAAFVEVSVRRCRAIHRATIFAGILFVCNLLFCLAWVYHDLNLRLWRFLTMPSVAIVLVCTPIFFGWLVWFRRKKQVELAYLLSLREQRNGV